MTDPLYIAELSDPEIGQKLILDGSEGRHAATVKRTKTGEQVYLSNGQGLAIHGTVTAVAKAEIEVQVEEILHAPEKKTRWIAVQALAKGERSDIAIQALTELGVDEIIAWQAERSIVRWQNKAEKGLAKWRNTVAESTKQSRRFTIPKVSYADTEAVCERIKKSQVALILHEDAETPLKAVELGQPSQVLFIVGPEGGISEREVEAFTDAGGKMVSLGDEVLRTSTAGLVCLAQLKVLL